MTNSKYMPGCGWGILIPRSGTPTAEPLVQRSLADARRRERCIFLISVRFSDSGDVGVISEESSRKDDPGSTATW